jgi:DNA-binding transcriptional LysR family regulator
MQKCMEWKNALFDWNRARAFLITAEEGSFSAAARALGQAQPTLGRQVSALEEEVGVALFERVGHTLTLTPTGLEMLEAVRAMNEAAGQFSRIAEGQSQSLEGTVRVAASQAVSAHLLPPVLARIQKNHPAIHLELVVSNATSDLRKREADIAVRHFRPQGEDLVGKLVKKESGAHLYATRAYLKRIGNPKTPKDLLEKGRILGFEDTKLMSQMMQAQGYPVDEGTFSIITDDHLVQWQLAKKGMGMCVMMEEVGDADSQLQRALPNHKPVVTLPIWLISHRELKTSRRIRVVFDLLAEALER